MINLSDITGNEPVAIAAFGAVTFPKPVYATVSLDGTEVRFGVKFADGEPGSSEEWESGVTVISGLAPTTPVVLGPISKAEGVRYCEDTAKHEALGVPDSLKNYVRKDGVLRYFRPNGTTKCRVCIQERDRKRAARRVDNRAEVSEAARARVAAAAAATEEKAA